MEEHVCCEHVKQSFDDAEQAWAALRRFEHQVLSIANGIRGIERTLNRKPAHGRAINKEV